MVARNEFGEVLKVWAKIHDLCTPTQATAKYAIALKVGFLCNNCCDQTSDTLQPLVHAL